MTIEPAQNRDLETSNQFDAAVVLAEDFRNTTVVLAVHDAESETSAKKLWEKSKDVRKKVEDQRKEKIEPHREMIAFVNDKAKKITAPLEEAEELLKKKINDYRTLLEIQRLEELKAKEEAAKIIGSELPVYVAPVEKVTRDGGVIAYTKTEKKFKIVEALEVPRQFLMVDEDAIALAIKQGCTQIPGIEIYEETKTILRSR